MLTAAELQEMRDMQASALPGTCTILRKTLTEDGAGGFTEAWETLAEGAPCRLSPEGGDESVVAARFQGKALRRLTLGFDEEIRGEDRVVIGGVPHEVLSVEGGAQWETARRVLLARLA